MLHILTKVKIVIMSIIDSNESDIILIHFINKQISKASYKHILLILLLIIWIYYYPLILI
jgi:hypothetical protein